jgi:hypothetical protein
VLIDAVVIVLVVDVLAVIVIGGRSKATRKRSGRADLLAALVPVVGGTVSGDQVLKGRYRGYDVQASLHTTDPAPPDNPGTASARSKVEIVRLRLLGARGGQPWSVWRAWTIPGTTWHFATSDGPVVGRLGRLGGLPRPDSELPDRLRAATLSRCTDRKAASRRGSTVARAAQPALQHGLPNEGSGISPPAGRPRGRGSPPASGWSGRAW